MLKHGSNRNRKPRNHARTIWQTDQIYLPSPQNEQKVAGGRVLHVQRVGVPRRSDLGTKKNGNRAYVQTAQGLVATSQAVLFAVVHIAIIMPKEN